MTNRNILLITGGSRGLGKNTALAAARRGIDIILTYRNRQDQADIVVAEIQSLGGRAVALQLDVGDSAMFPAFAQQVKQTLADTWQRERFDFLVNNAGAGLYAAITDTTEAQFDEVMRVHLKAPYFLTQALLPLMNDGGRILNLSSGLARFSLPGSSAYAMMKAGIDTFTRYLAVELGPRRITANSVAPGAIATDFGGGRVRDTPALNQLIASQTPLGRVGEADDIGGAIAGLLGEEYRWLNAQRVELAGGIHA